MNNEVKLSGKTAMRRNAISAPARWLAENRLIIGDALDYGCGHGHDADQLHMDKYDPVWFPNEGTKAGYDTILVTYVLNTMESFEQMQEVLRSVWTLLNDGTSRAYISVRNDNRYLTGRKANGTFQCWITDIARYRLIKRCSGFRIFEMKVSQGFPLEPTGITAYTMERKLEGKVLFQGVTYTEDVCG